MPRGLSQVGHSLRDPNQLKSPFYARKPFKHPKSGPGPALCTSASPTAHFHLSTCDPGWYTRPSLPLDHSDGASGASLCLLAKCSICSAPLCSVTQLCLTLLRPHGPLGSSVHVSWQEYWRGLPFTSPGDLPWRRSREDLPCRDRT